MEERKNVTVLLLIALVAIILVIVFYILIRTSEISKYCGNGICEKNENRCNCPKDCGECQGSCGTCKEQKCINDICECVELKECCGNGICEIGEDEWNCCIDCNCNIEGMVCNITSRSCTVPEVKISDEEAISLFKEYLIGIGENLTEITAARFVASPAVFQGKPVKRVCMLKSLEFPTGLCGIISEDREVLSVTTII
ncbi:MAG: hypothetical protein QXK48_02780 [Candidatus Aenigmatarchaeota archaeon]